MIETKDTHKKIIKVLNEKGPSLPINIAKELEMNSLFVSAFLSEMVNEKKIKVSHLKVGGSPLYFLEGQEEKLERFSNYLHPKENEALILLKEKKVLKDAEMEPAIRVALRSIRDFAVGFKKDEEIYWRHASVSEDEVKNILEPKIKITPPVQDSPRQPVQAVIVSAKQRKSRRVSEEPKGRRLSIKEEFENPVVVKEKPKKQKPKSEFVLKVIDFINRRGFKIIEERDYKINEYKGIVQIKSELGMINFLCQAKDKKKISEGDLKKLLSEAQKIPLPALFVYNGELSKKAEEYFLRYKSVLKGLRV